MVRSIATTLYLGDRVTNADTLGAKLKSSKPGGKPFFTPEGERRVGEDEYVIVLRPQFVEGNRVSEKAVFDVYTRKAGRWEPVAHLVK
jgi:hypothetical protein